MPRGDFKFSAWLPPVFPITAKKDYRSCSLNTDQRQSFYRIWLIPIEAPLLQRLQRDIRPVKLAFKRNRFCPFIGFRTC